MKVRVTKEGFMFGAMQKVGAEITLEKDEHFSKNWMEEIDEVVNEESDPSEKEAPEPKGKTVKPNKPKD